MPSHELVGHTVWPLESVEVTHYQKMTVFYTRSFDSKLLPDWTRYVKMS